jgi:predicted ribosomally synthesized peptide with SipW-like signal peptide
MPKKERDTMSKKTKRYLMLLVAVGLIAVAAGGSGTFASFSAETANNGNYFATGTLFLHNTGPNGTSCTSESDTNNNQNSASGSNGCDWLFHVGPNLLTENANPTAALTLSNAGTVNGQTLKFQLGGPCVDAAPTIASLTTQVTSGATFPATTLHVSGLTQTLLAGTKITLTDGAPGSGQTYTVTADTSGPDIQVTGPAAAQNYTVSGTKVTLAATFSGGASLCSGLRFYIQEVDASNNPVKCVYGGSGTTCNPLTATPFSSISAIAPNSWATLTLATDEGANTATHTGIDPGKTRHFLIGVKVPSLLTNSYQNDQITFDVQWQLNQV